MTLTCSRSRSADEIDPYYAHLDDETVPLEETVAAFGQLVADGLVRHVTVSNYAAERIREWVAGARLELSPEEVAVLDRVSEWSPARA